MLFSERLRASESVLAAAVAALAQRLYKVKVHNFNRLSVGLKDTKKKYYFS